MIEDNRSYDEKIQRMEELMKPIEQQLMMCDDMMDQLMIASCMLVMCRDLFAQHLGERGAKDMYVNFCKENGYV